MRTVDETLTCLLKLAKENRDLADQILATAEDPNPLHALCTLSTSLGLPLYEMDLIAEGEEMYAMMKRSTNGGGENSPKLQYEDDYYELFMASIREL